MSTWTEKLRIAVPAAYRDLGNKAADLFDPNTLGRETFSEPNAYAIPDDYDPETAPPLDADAGTTPTHCMCSTQLVAEYVPMLQAPMRNADVWMPVLAQMAEQRGLYYGEEMLTREEIEALCEVFMFDQECANLVRIDR